MYNYSYISVAALFCYLFLFIMFMAAHKNKIIHSFLLLLTGFLLWTGGSLLMRIEMWPGVEFWFHYSIIGLIFLPFLFFNFVYAMVDSRDRSLWRLWLFLAVANNIINIRTGFYIPCPEVIRLENGSAAFVYHMGRPVLLLFLLSALPLVHMALLIQRSPRDGSVAKGQLNPILWGIAVLFAGHLGKLLPALHGFPTDVLSGIVNAVFMFYAICKKHLFKLTLLVSRGTIYSASTLLVALMFANYISGLDSFIQNNIPVMRGSAILVISVTFTLATFAVSALLKRLIDALFMRDEKLRAENLKEFSAFVSGSLDMEEIAGKIASVIEETIGVDRIYVCLEKLNDKNFEIVNRKNIEEQVNLCLQKGNPLIQWITEKHKCMLVSDFRKSGYHSQMWESQKKRLHDLNLQCVLPLIDEETLVGVVLLSGKAKGKGYAYDDISFLESLSSIASIAMGNSRLYKKVYMEARTDELTGLLNRRYFYEILDLLYEEEKKKKLALIIFNIDDFKLYNQLYGIKEGDAALQKVALIIKSTVGESGYVARYSGKEFAVILPDCGGEAAKEIAKSIRRQIADMGNRDGNCAFKALTVSCGVCAIPDSAGSVKELVENADMAVYTVKRKGKNGVLLFDIGASEGQGETNLKMAQMEVYTSYQSTIFALTAAIDTKDHYTFSHSNHVAAYACALSRAYGMNKDFIELVREAALLHDVGKIGIPESILNKPGKLEESEYEIMKGHVENSIGIIRNLPSLDYVIPAVLGHHERYDGKGYPRGLKGEDIPFSARILCIADSFDAMISKRSYKEEFSLEYALQELLAQAGRQFDPELASVFVLEVKSGRLNTINENI